MENDTILDVVPGSASDQEYEAIVDRNIARLKLMQQRMDDDQREIEMLRAETDAAIESVMQTLKVYQERYGRSNA